MANLNKDVTLQGDIMRTCTICGNEVTYENDGLLLTQELLSFDELERFKLYKKDLCIDCKRDMFFANIIGIL